jgi:flagellar hook-associated protein 3 FlgL
MRISTQQFYYHHSQSMSNKESELNDQTKYLTSGKKVLTAKDDAVQYSTLIGYKEQMSAINRYKRNITQAESRNNLQELSFAQAEDVMQEIKQFMIKANNGVLGNSERNVIAAQVKNTLNQMLDIANTRDESGNSIFSGFQTDKTPFSLGSDNSVLYSGDKGIRDLQISNNVSVATNQSGDAAFLKVPNSAGDFSAVYQTNTSGTYLKNAVVIDPSNYDDVTNPPNYRFDFADTTADGNVNEVTITDSASNTLLVVNPFVAGQAIGFNGIEVQFEGNPAPGDQIDIAPKENLSIFETIKNAIDWISAPSNSAQSKAEYNDTLSQVNESLNHMSDQRAEMGIRLQLIENQDGKHEDKNLYLAQGAANIEDLDYAKAVSDFEQAQTLLQASQQVFAKVKELSLFNYI